MNEHKGSVGCWSEGCRKPECLEAIDQWRRAQAAEWTGPTDRPQRGDHRPQNVGRR